MDNAHTGDGQLHDVEGYEDSNSPVEIVAPLVRPLVSHGQVIVLLHHPQGAVVLVTQVALRVGECHPHRLGLHALVLQAPQAQLDSVKLLHDLIKIVQERDGCRIAGLWLVSMGGKGCRGGRSAVLVEGRRG